MSATDEPCSPPPSGMDGTAARPCPRQARGAAQRGGPAAPSSRKDAAAITLLAEILVGERPWSLAEVGRLVVLRDVVARSSGSRIAGGEGSLDAD